jgi:hypothetical protein
MKNVFDIRFTAPDRRVDDEVLLAEPADGHEKVVKAEGVSNRDHTPEPTWLQTTSQLIPAWRSQARDIYLRWSVADRALRSARQACTTMPDPYDIAGIRPGEAGYQRRPLVSWSPSEAETAHEQAIDLVTRLALRDLVEMIEQSILQAHEIMLLSHPHALLEQPDAKGLKRLYERRLDNPDAWQKSWTKFIAKWRRDRSPNEISNVVQRYWMEARLFLPVGYEPATLDQVNAFMAVILAVRDHIANRSKHVDAKLAELSTQIDSAGFSYDCGDVFEVCGAQMELIEAFYAEYLELLSLTLKAKAVVQS